MVRVLGKWSLAGDRMSREQNTPPPLTSRQGVHSDCGSGEERGDGSQRKIPPPVCQPLATLDSAVHCGNDIIQSFEHIPLLIKDSVGSRFNRMQSLFA